MLQMGCKFLNVQMISPSSSMSSKLTEIRANNHFDRMTSRLADSFQFRIQEEINIRDDEIARLKSDLAYFRGMARTVNDSTKTKQKSVVEQYSELKKALFDAKSQLEMEKSQMAIEHAKTLRRMDAKHNSEVESIRRQIESIEFPAPKKPPRKPDPVKEFVKAAGRLTGRKSSSIIDDQSHSSSDSGSIADSGSYSTTRLGRSSEKESARVSEIAQLSMRREESEKRVRDLKSQISSVEKEIEEHSIEPVSESLDDFDEPKNRDLEERLSRARAAHEKRMDALHDKYESEKERGRILEKEIADAKVKAMVESRKAKEKSMRKSSVMETRRTRKYEEMRAYLDSMTASQKDAKLAELRSENRALKKEIARLDFKVYGRGGKYSKWRNL